MYIFPNFIKISLIRKLSIQKYCFCQILTLLGYFDLTLKEKWARKYLKLKITENSKKTFFFVFWKYPKKVWMIIILFEARIFIISHFFPFTIFEQYKKIKIILLHLLSWNSLWSKEFEHLSREKKSMWKKMNISNSQTDLFEENTGKNEIHSFSTIHF